jgi:hypothetical protein
LSPRQPIRSPVPPSSPHSTPARRREGSVHSPAHSAPPAPPPQSQAPAPATHNSSNLGDLHIPPKRRKNTTKPDDEDALSDATNGSSARSLRKKTKTVPVPQAPATKASKSNKKPTQNRKKPANATTNTNSGMPKPRPATRASKSMCRLFVSFSFPTLLFQCLAHSSASRAPTILALLVPNDGHCYLSRSWTIRIRITICTCHSMN